MSTPPTEPGPNNPGQIHGTSALSPVARKTAVAWWMWLLPLLLLLAVLLFALHSCGGSDEKTADRAAIPASSGSAATPALALKRITLPGGSIVELESGSLGYQLQEFLASNGPAPRTFTFDKLNFATASADLPADAHATVVSLAQILRAYPNARVRLEGYADARGTEAANAQLGARRAESVSKALLAENVPQDHVSTGTGGEHNPIDTNATPQGRADNRRTELVVTAK